MIIHGWEGRGLKFLFTLYNLAPERISDFVEFDLANAIKFTIYRLRPSGSPGDWDILGCQHCGPLPGLEVP